MNKEEAFEIVKKQLTEHRYNHTIGVTETAIMLAERYGANKQKAELAGIFHDYAKFRPKQEMIDIIKREKMKQDLLEYSSELWHAPVGAFLVKTEVGITDQEVLDAIRFHTTGRIGMTVLEKVIFLADYIEPSRSFPGVEQVRELAKTNLDLAILQAVSNTIQFLLKQGQLIYPQTIETYNDLQHKVKQS